MGNVGTVPTLIGTQQNLFHGTSCPVIVTCVCFMLSVQVGEVGELSEIFQWKGEVPKGLPGWDEAEKEHLGEELADVLLYLVRLSDMCGVDLGKAALRKMEINARKYPVEQCRGSSKKHTCYSSNINISAAAGDNTTGLAAKKEHNNGV